MHVAAVPDGDVPVLEERAGQRGVEEALHAGLEVAPERRPSAAGAREGADWPRSAAGRRGRARRGGARRGRGSAGRSVQALGRAPGATARMRRPYARRRAAARKPCPSATRAGRRARRPPAPPRPGSGGGSPVPSHGGGPSAVSGAAGLGGLRSAPARRQGTGAAPAPERGSRPDGVAASPPAGHGGPSSPGGRRVRVQAPPRSLRTPGLVASSASRRLAFCEPPAPCASAGRSASRSAGASSARRGAPPSRTAS